MTAFSKASYQDSIIYPVFSIDAFGTKTVTISINQEKVINIKLIKLERCESIAQQQQELIHLMQIQIDVLEHAGEKCDSTLSKQSSIIENQESIISEKDIQLNLKNELISNYDKQIKQSKKRVLGWKIGTFVTIGVFVVAVPTIIGILLK